MKTLDFLTVAFSALAIAASAAAAGLFVQRKSQKGEPPSSIIFAVLSFCFLAVGCLGYLFSGAAVVLPVTVFLAVLCLILHVSAESPAVRRADPAAAGSGEALFSVPEAEMPAMNGDFFPDTGEEPEENTEDALLQIGQEFISHISESMTGGVNLDKLLDFANQTLIRTTKADGGVVFLVDDFEDILNAKAFSGQFPPPYKLPDDLPHKPVRVETSFRYVQLPFKDNLFGEAAVSAEAVLIPDGTADPRVYVNGPEDFLKPGSYIIAPLSIKGKVVGIAGLARLPGNPAFTETEFRTAKTLANYAGAAINNVYCIQEILEHADLERGAEIAAEIQNTLQPKRLPDLPEVGFGFFFQPTKGICGDYCDVILARRDRIALIMADVAGKGMLSSMVMISLRAILHLVTNTTKDAATILDWVNKGITGKINVDHYATLTYVSYSADTHELEYANAGHQPMLLWRSAEKKIERIHQNSDPIGVERTSAYSEIKLTVEPGDIIILYTDGLVEALNAEGVQYGVGGLSKVVAENEDAPAKDIAAAVKHDLKNFLGSATMHDDQSLLVMKIKN